MSRITVESAGLGGKGEVLLWTSTIPQVNSGVWVYSKNGSTLRGDLVSDETRTEAEALAYGRKVYGYGDDVVVSLTFAEHITVSKFSGPL